MPFKVCASWKMPSASAKATSQVAIPPSLGPVGDGHIEEPFGPDLHPLTADPKQCTGAEVTNAALLQAVRPCMGVACMLALPDEFLA